MSYEGILQSLEGEYSLKWANASDSTIGFGVSMSAAGQANLATVNTHPPLGIVMAAVKQNEFVRIIGRDGAIVEAVCGAAITTAYPLLVSVTVDGTGRFITAAKTATPSATREYGWGYALTSTTAAGQKFAMLFSRHEMDIT